MRRCFSFHAVGLILLTVGVAHADLAVFDNQPGVAVGGTAMVVVSTATDEVSSVVSLGSMSLGTPRMDMVLTPDGWLVWGGSSSIELSRVRPGGVTPELRFSRAIDTVDLAVGPSGGLYNLNRFSPGDPTSRLERVLVDGSVEEVIPFPGVVLKGMDIPRSGPLEGGALVLVEEGAYPDGLYYLHRFRREADGSLAFDGRFGPLAELWTEREARDARVPTPRPTAEHVAARATGESFLVTEPCTNRVLEYDLEGTLLREFAQVPTPMMPDVQWPTVFFPDFLRNIHVTADDHVYVTQLRSLYHYDPAGRLARRVDHMFGAAQALTDTTFRPFESAGVTCAPRGPGFWKRQCNPSAYRPRGGPRGLPAPPGPSIHPAFRDGRFALVRAAADRTMAPYGVTACDALWPVTPSDPRQKAMFHLAAVAFNLADKRLGMNCVVEVEGAPRRVRDILADIDRLLASPDAADWRTAADLAATLHGGD